MSLKLTGLAPGDIVETRRRLRITGTGSQGGVALADELTGEGFFIDPSRSHGTLSVTTVKKAAKPRPKVGDALTVEQVRATGWKRGTVLEAAGYVFVLNGDGEWFSPGAHGPERDLTRSFEDLDRDLNGADHNFTVVRLP